MKKNEFAGSCRKEKRKSKKASDQKGAEAENETSYLNERALFFLPSFRFDEKRS